MKKGVIYLAAHVEKHKLKNGKNCWRVVIEHGIGSNGKRKRIYKNVSGTKRDAEALMAKLLSELNTGSYIEPSKLTMTEYLRDWMNSYVRPNLSPTTVDSYNVNVEKHLIPYVGHILLQQLKPLHVQNLYSDLLSNGRTDGTGGLSAKSVLYIHRNLHESLEHAVKMQLVSRNVAALVTLPKAKKYHAQVYTPEELNHLLKVAQGTDMELPIYLAASLGLRRGEILGLLWSNVNIIDKKITISNNLVPTSNGNINKAPKSVSSSRTIELPDGLIPILKRHSALQARNRLKLGSGYHTGNYVYCQTDGSPYCPGYLSRKFNAFLKKHKLKQIRLHDLRHSHATLMLACGVPAKVASERLGHSNIAVTLDLYSHVLDSMQKDAAQKINTGIFELIDS